MGYVFKRSSPAGEPFAGDKSLLLSSYLAAPRLLQVSLPRMLRSRSQQPSSATASPPTSQADSSSTLVSTGRGPTALRSSSAAPKLAGRGRNIGTAQAKTPTSSLAAAPVPKSVPQDDSSQASMRTRAAARQQATRAGELPPASACAAGKSQAKAAAFGLGDTGVISARAAEESGAAKGAGGTLSPSKRNQGIQQAAMQGEDSPSKRTRAANSCQLLQAR